MPFFAPRVSSFHFFKYLYEGVVNEDGNYLMLSFASARFFMDEMNGKFEPDDENEMPDVSYSLEEQDPVHFQIARIDEGEDTDFVPPMPVEIRKYEGSNGTYVGWADPDERPSGKLWWTYKNINLTSLKILAEKFVLAVWDFENTPRVIADYDSLTFDTDDPPYRTGPSHTVTHETIIFQAGGGSVKVVTGAVPVSGDEKLLGLRSAVSVTTTRTYIIYGWVYVDDANQPTKGLGFSPTVAFPDSEILGAKVWDPADGPTDEWVLLYTIWRAPTTQTSTFGNDVGLYLIDLATFSPSTGVFEVTADTVSSTVYTDTWTFSNYERDLLAISEPSCIKASGQARETLLMQFYNTEGDAFGCDWDGTGYVPLIRPSGNQRAFGMSFRDPVSETDTDGNSTLPSVQIRKYRTLKVGPIPEWQMEKFCLGLGCDTIILNGDQNYVSTGEAPDVKEDSAERDILWSAEANVYPKNYPYGYKGG